MRTLAPASLLLALAVAPLAGQGLRFDLGRNSRSWEPELAIPWMEFSAKDGREWVLLDLSSGLGLVVPDGPAHAVARFHTDVRMGAHGFYAAFGALLEFDDAARPGVGIRLQLGHQFNRYFHAALQWEGVVSPQSAVLNPGAHGCAALVVGVKFN